jgi:hypothetical protein
MGSFGYYLPINISVLSSVLHSLGFPIKILHLFLFSPMCAEAPAAHLTFLLTVPYTIW